MPTDNTEATAGRVTRSLRKRLTSIDSETSSRPGTPVVVNLEAIQEAVTPLKRVTRRVSLNAPAATPSKIKGRLENIEVTNSPARRSTRRRSVSIQEQEEFLVKIKPKELSVNALKEEDISNKTPDAQNRRSTRSSSKSPLELETLKAPAMKGSSKKSATQVEEIINLEDSSDGSYRTPQKRKQTKLMIKKEKNVDDDTGPSTESLAKSLDSSVQEKAPKEQLDSSKKNRMTIEQPSPAKVQSTQNSPRKSESVQKHNRSGLDLTPINSSAELESSQKDSVNKKRKSGVDSIAVDAFTELNPSQKDSNKKNRKSGVDSTPVKASTELEFSQKDSSKKNRKSDEDSTPAKTGNHMTLEQPILEKAQSSQDSTNRSESEQKQNGQINANSTTAEAATELEASETETSKKSRINIELKAKIDQSNFRRNLSLKNKSLEIQSNSSKKPTEKNSPQKKNVAFNETADEDTIKSVYPKTPGLTKSKSYIWDSSKDDEKEASVDKEDQSITEDENKSGSDDLVEKDHEVLGTKTPYKLKVKAVESSTPIHSASPKKNKSSVVEAQKEESTKKIEETESAILFPKSWTQSVSGKANEMAKIDSIESEENIRKKLEEEKALKKSQSLTPQNQNKQKARRRHVLSDSEEDDLVEEDDENEDVEEEEYSQKSTFLDDEAMEVAEGEDSMDSQERAYLEENEIPVYGESIGSEDSEHEDDDKEDEADEEDEGFIISDTEDIILAAEETDSEDNVDEIVKEKIYKRIVKISESSNEEEKPHEELRGEEEQSEKQKLNSSKRDKLEKINDEEEETTNKKDNEIENKDEHLNVDNSERRKSLKINEEKEKDKEIEVKEDGTKGQQKSSSKESEANKNSETEDNNSNIMMGTVQKDALKPSKKSDTEGIDTSGSQEGIFASVSNPPMKSRKSPNRSKQKIPQSEDETDDQEQSASVSKSPKRSLIGDNNYEDKNTYLSRRAESMDESIPSSEEKENNQSQKEAEQDQIADSSKPEQSSSKKDSRKSSNRNVNASDENNKVEPSKKDKNTSLTQSRKSLKQNKETEMTGVDDSLKEMSTKTEDDEKEESSQNLNVSKKSQNKKRKSMGRTSTKEENAKEDEKEKSVPSSEDVLEPEETLSASEGKSLNSSKRSEKSPNDRKISFVEKDEERFPEDDSDSEDAAQNKNQQKLMYEDINVRVDTSSEQEEGDSEGAQKDESDEEEGNSSEEGEEARFSDAEDEEQEEKTSARRSVMNFFGDKENKGESSPQTNLNSSSRKSGNNSILNETFELQRKSISIATRENLHQSTLRKSLNQSQLGKNKPSECSGSDNSLVKGEVKLLSISNVEFKKKQIKCDEKSIRNSFTIGVSVRNTPSADKPLRSPSSSFSGESDIENAFSEQEDLEKIKNVHHVGPYTSRKSLSSSLKAVPLNPDDSEQHKRIKRTSLYMQEKAASQSFVENITEEKKKVASKRKRQSNSFCAVPPAENKTTQDESQSVIKPKKPSESENKVDIQRILSRCDEILEAANNAKREAKLNAKKSKVKKPKWMDKEEKAPKDAEDEMKIPLVSKKELKRKEKIKKELAKAIKHSTAMLKAVDPMLKRKLKVNQNDETKPTETNSIPTTKRLPTDFLEALEEVPRKKKKSKETTSPPEKISNKSNSRETYTLSDIPVEKKKKKSDKEIIETVTGTVIVEPSTPVKLRYQNGFRESPKTPAGFKIEDINSDGHNKKEKLKKPVKRLFTPSGEFVEEDLSVSSTKFDSKKEKTHKRKRHIEEPVHCLPKTQWTPSGVFVEEDVNTARPLANSTATQFMVTSLNSNRKNKNPANIVSSATLNSALSFKENALFNDKVRRETSRELVHRKQRKLANNQY